MNVEELKVSTMYISASTRSNVIIRTSFLSEFNNRDSHVYLESIDLNNSNAVSSTSSVTQCSHLMKVSIVLLAIIRTSGDRELTAAEITVQSSEMIDG